MIFRRFPYTTLNDINLDWIIKQVKQLVAAVQGKQDKPESAGTAGQVLGLDNSLNPVWVYQSALPAGGSAYEFLMKNSNADYDTEWVSLYSSETPLMDRGNGDPGLSTLLSRRDHRHPSDTSKLDKPESAGTAGQVLGLDSNLNPVWADKNGLPAGGSVYQFLMKNSGADYDARWTGLYSSQTPLMDSVNGSPGSSTLLSSWDHRHPSDTSKQDKPASPGTAGQVLGLDSNLNPVWVDQSGGGGTTNYNSLENKPQIQGVTLTGNKTASDLGLALSADLAEKQDAPALSGTAGQVLGLDSSLNPVWADKNGLPAGGSVYQFLMKNSGADYDARWTGLYSSQTPLMDSVNGSPGSSTLLSSSDHRHPSDTSKQDKPASPGNAGQVLGLDSSLNPVWVDQSGGALAFTVTLSAAGWSNSAQTVNNANFIASGHSYIVSPASASFATYSAAQIYADDVTISGQMTFHCTTAPSAALTVNILGVVSA